jgi:hypothetical protein
MLSDGWTARFCYRRAVHLEAVRPRRLSMDGPVALKIGRREDASRRRFAAVVRSGSASPTPASQRALAHENALGTRNQRRPTQVGRPKGAPDRCSWGRSPRGEPRHHRLSVDGPPGRNRSAVRPSPPPSELPVKLLSKNRPLGRAAPGPFDFSSVLR